MRICITVMCINMINLKKNPLIIHTDYDTQFLHPYLLNINYGRNGLWMKRTMAEPECGGNVSKAFVIMTSLVRLTKDFI
jgi:hypothetical protein